MNNPIDIQAVLINALSSLGIASPFLIQIIRWGYAEYQRLQKAVEFSMTLEAKLDDLDMRVERLGGGKTNQVIQKQLSKFKANLKESFKRRDDRIEHIDEQLTTVRTKISQDNQKLPGQRIAELEARLKKQDETTRLLVQVNSKLTAEIKALQEKVATSKIERPDIDKLELQVVLMRRALVALGTKQGVDTAYLLHATKQDVDIFKEESIINKKKDEQKS